MPLSYSQLSLYRRCPKQYEYAVIKKIGRAISAPESYGSSVHNALKRWGELEMRKAKKDEPTKGQLPLFVDAAPAANHEELTLTTLLTFWRTCFIAEGYENRAARDMALQYGEQALTSYFDWWNSAPRTVVGIEKSFSLPLPDRPDVVLAGRIDRIERTEKGLVVIDYKTSQPRQQKDVDIDLQLSMYAAAVQNLYGALPVELMLLHTTENGVVPVVTERNASQVKDALISIRSLKERMESGDYRATPSVEKCRHCPYRDICASRAI